MSQQLLFPERLELSGDEYALLEENAVEFAALGFDIGFCGDGAVEVKGTPAELPPDAVDKLLFELLQAFRTPLSVADVRREKVAAVMARGAARNTPRVLSRDAARAACRDGKRQLLALGQGDSGGDHARRVAREAGIMAKDRYICTRIGAGPAARRRRN